MKRYFLALTITLFVSQYTSAQEPAATTENAALSSKIVALEAELEALKQLVDVAKTPHHDVPPPQPQTQTVPVQAEYPYPYEPYPAVLPARRHYVTYPYHYDAYPRYVPTYYCPHPSYHGYGGLGFSIGGGIGLSFGF